MEDTIDYSQYTFRELVEASTTLDSEQYPDRAEQLQSLIAQHPDNPANQIEKASDGRKVNVNFHGDGKEFFNIWIVNILLTIVTLGIYSAWATVRTNRYFYSNTEVDGRRLYYLADPIKILKGRVVAVVLFTLVYLLNIFDPLFGLVAMGVLVFLAPLFICMSLRFKLRMTAYRNVTFNFSGQYARAFVLFILLPIASVFTLYLLFPWVLKKIDEFIYSNASYGNKPLVTNISAKEYYLASLVSAAVGMGLFFVFAIVSALVMGGGMAAFGDSADFNESTGALIFATLGYVFFVVGYVSIVLTASSLYETWIRNHVYNNTSIQDVCDFHSTLSTMDLVLLRLSNFLLIVCTLGLAVPWTKVRTARFFSQVTSVTILAGADEVIDERGQSSALGEEVADVFDFDIGIA
ncbi:YjgN family protein [Aliiglaciecola sp.]|nr:YjgN family protein [Aliiglaciecola sp.]